MMASITNLNDFPESEHNFTKENITIHSPETPPTVDSATSPTMDTFEPSILTPPNPSVTNSVSQTELPSHLFWVPAHLHPEIAPQEFNRWLEQHSSAINHKEDRVTRRKSVLGLHCHTPTTSSNSNLSGNNKNTEIRRNRTMSEHSIQVVSPTPTPLPERTNLRRARIRTPQERTHHRHRRNQNTIDSLELSPKSLENIDALSLSSSELLTTPKQRKDSLNQKPLNHSRSVDDLTPTTSSELDASSKPNLIEPSPRIDSIPTTPLSPISNEDNEPSRASIFSNPTSPEPQNDASLPKSEIISEPLSPKSSTKSSSKRSGAFSWLFGSDSKDTSTSENSPKPKISSPTSTEPATKSSPRSPTSNNRPILNDGIVSDISVSFEPSSPGYKKKSLNFFFKSKDKKDKKPKDKNSDSTKPNKHSKSSSSSVAPAKPEYDPKCLPVPVEQAMYRLSHTKLASPRRPLAQQVVISNMMLWYLEVVNQRMSRDHPPSIAPNRGYSTSPKMSPHPRQNTPQRIPKPKSPHLISKARYTQGRHMPMDSSSSEDDDDDDLELSDDDDDDDMSLLETIRRKSPQNTLINTLS